MPRAPLDQAEGVHVSLFDCYCLIVCQLYKTRNIFIYLEERKKKTEIKNVKNFGFLF